MSTHLVEYEHDLSKRELAALKDEILDQLSSIDELAAEKAEVVKEYTERLKGLHESLLTNRTSVRTGVQTREVRCDAVEDHEAGLVRMMDVITGDERGTRSMDDHEYQVGLEIGDKAEYIRVMSVEALPKSCAGLVGEIFMVDQRQKEGKDRHCYFRDESNVRRKIPMAHVELYNWEEIESLEEQAEACEG